MKKLLSICALTIFTITINSQTIKDYAGKVITKNEVTQNIIADPEQMNPSFQHSFKVEFNVTYGLQLSIQTFFLIQINAIKPLIENGYFYKPAYAKPGKYYSCTELGTMCDGLEINGVTIVAVWIYKGQEFKTGAIQLSSRNGNFIGCTTEITKPGGIDMPYDAIKSGEAKIGRIEFITWDFKNEQAILNLLDSRYK